jgi:DNA-directed RNA polymerase specialized sigma24 family protein
MDDLWRRLYLYAVVLVGGAKVVMRCGLSAQDLATETLNKYLLSPNGLGWREDKGSLTTFLGTVLRNRFIDCLRREKALAASHFDEIELRPPVSDTGDLDEHISGKELTHKLLNLIEGHRHQQRLCDFIHASQMITGGGKVNQQLAELMKVDEGEVINCRKMLLRVTGVKEIFEEFDSERKRN